MFNSSSFLFLTEPNELQIDSLWSTLPGNNGQPFERTFGGAKLFFFKSNDPFYQYCDKEIDDYFFFVQGTFYESPDFSSIKRSYLETNLSKLSYEFNGNYSGIIFSRLDNTLTLFSDIWGFEKIYHTSVSGKTLVSSHIWPLLQYLKKMEINRLALAERFIFGFELGVDTLFKDVFVHSPGDITSINIVKKNISVSHVANPFIDLEQRKRNPVELIQISKRIFQDLDGYLPYHKWITTLTGGNDSRVLLNSLVQNGFVIDSITGYSTLNQTDLVRSRRLSSYVNSNFHSIKYNTEKKEIRDNLILLTSGYEHGQYFSNLAEYLNNKYTLCFYGLSGDTVSGNFNNPRYFEEDYFVEQIFQQYNKLRLSSEIVENLFNVSINEIKGRISAFFVKYIKYFDRKHLFFLFSKNEDNFKQVLTFGQSIRFGPSPFLFFHDKRVSSFYFSCLDSQWFRQELHHKISYFNNLPFALIGSANSSRIPSFMIPKLNRVMAFMKYAKNNDYTNNHLNSEYVSFEPKSFFSRIESDFEVNPSSFDIFNKEYLYYKRNEIPRQKIKYIAITANTIHSISNYESLFKSVSMK